MINRVFVGSGAFGETPGGASTEMMDIEGMTVSSYSCLVVQLGRCGCWVTDLLQAGLIPPLLLT